MAKNPGRIVKTKDGILGRTKNSVAPINGKIAVYLATETVERGAFKIAKAYSDDAILCDPKTLTVIGYID